LLRLDSKTVEHLNRALVVAAGVAAYHDTKFRELAHFPGVKELFADLHAAGVRLGVITHGLTVKQAEKLVRLGLVPYLDPEAIFISDQIGVAKPNPKLWLTALREMRLQAPRVMYIGDNPRNDVAPPKSLGMIAVWARLVTRHALDGEKPDHVIESFADLRKLLREHYSIALPAGA
jgi:putative hydrolase of the HAD superfamily